MTSYPLWADFSEEVAAALKDGCPVVAVESSVWAQGLPRPLNFEVALEVGAQVRLAGAVPAVIWLDAGRIRYGVSDAKLAELCEAQDIPKVGVGDMPGVLAKGGSGATTVSASLVAAEQVGIEVLATGGLGGIHLEWSTHPDFSADLGQLARTRCLSVCSGVKSVIDIEATVEILETLGIPIAFYDCDAFPQFYTAGRVIGIGFRIDTPEEAARAHHYSLELLGRGLTVAQPVPSEFALDQDEVDKMVADGMACAQVERSRGNALTPFLLDHLARVSGGRTLEANRALLLNNAHLAGKIAAALSRE